ncbi:long-chain acyl-CoA synthetase [Catenulispora sp. EB89]|uniref:AMP-binding protein n=1 Tax=Catenulispora sp. EB89 TaxID=3156257 RepID=UPI003511B050
MIDPVINHAAGGVVARGHQISFVRLGSAQSMDLAELHEAAGRLAGGLAALGLGPGDRLGILAANSLEWVLLDLAALRLKAVTAGFEPGKFELEALPAKYGLKMLFTDRPFEGDAQGVIRSVGEVAALAAEPAVAAPVIPAPGFTPDEPTTIKFTSGSSGEPKGLAATAGSIDSSVSAVQELFQHGEDDNLFVFLPLSLLQQRFWVYSALFYGHDVTVSTYEAALPSLRQVRPTVVMGVPAFYEAAMAHIEGQARRAGAEDGATAVRSAAQDLFGDRIRYLWTGSAPARAAMLRFFTDDAGLPLYEGYGLNEACIVAKNHPGAHREGSVGRVLPRKKVLFDQDGVISIHSEYPVNDRYEYAPPGESERMFLPGDVVRTGDVGYLDRDGFLYIQGRADDTIVLDNGRKVIVRPIEERLRGGSAIQECVVFCPDQTRLVAVVSPAAGPVDEAAIAEHVARANAEAAADEQIARVVIAQPRFSIDNGLLTSQFKPRRAEIFELYRDRITGVGGV